MDLLQYIKKHAIIYTKIGDLINDNCVATEVIFDTPEAIVKYLLDNNCFISVIRWWDRTPLNLSSPIGGGGKKDPRNSQYYFAETYIEAYFNKSTTYSEYIEYINSIKDKYSSYDIYPAFDIYVK